MWRGMAAKREDVAAGGAPLRCTACSCGAASSRGAAPLAQLPPFTEPSFTTLQAASGASRPAKKVRRLDDSSEVVYRRIHHRSASPATAAAHRLPPASAQASAALEAGIAATAAAGDTFGN